MRKLFFITGLIRSVFDAWFVKQLIAGMILVAALVIVTSIMIGALLLSGLYIVYIALLQYGLSTLMALCSVAGLAFVLAVLGLAIIVLCVRKIERIPTSFIQSSPAGGQAGQAISAFIDGLAGHRTTSKTRAKHP